MTWRIVEITQNCKLESKMGYLVVRGQYDKKIHLSEIAILIIETTEAAITASLLCELSKKKIKVIFCDEKHNPYGEVVSMYGSFDSAEKLKVQINWTESAKSTIWAAIVRDKIRKQMGVLIRNGFLEHSSFLRGYAEQVEDGDLTNREGHAAKVYFNAIFGNQFSRNDEDVINSCLNYGYAILLSAFNREIVTNGYNTQIGVFHEGKTNHYNLASDIMESFRPIVDEHVLGMQPQKFGTEEKQSIANILNHQVIIDGKLNFITNAIKIYTRSFFDSMENGDLERLKTYEVQVHESNRVLRSTGFDETES